MFGFSWKWIGKVSGKDSCPSLNLMCHFTENPYTQKHPMLESWRSQYVTGFWPFSSMVMSVYVCVCIHRSAPHCQQPTIAISIKSSLKERNFIYIACKRVWCWTCARSIVVVVLILALTVSVPASLHFTSFMHVHGGKPCGFIWENKTAHKQEKQQQQQKNNYWS